MKLQIGLAAYLVLVLVSSPTAKADESEWKLELLQGPDLRGIWGSGPNDVFAVGDDGTIVHYDGATWSEMDSGTTRDLKGVWGGRPNDVFAVGGSGTILHYDGSSWSAMSSGTTCDLKGIWGTSGTDVYAVGCSSVFRWDGSNWSEMCHLEPTVSHLPRLLHDIWGSSSTDIFVAGPYTITHYDGTTWSEIWRGNDNYFDISTTCYGIWGSSSSDVFALINRYAEWDRYAEVLHWDGASWSEVWHHYVANPSLPGPENVHSVWGSSGSDVFVVREAGKIVHYDGADWSDMTSGTTRSLLDVWGSGPNDVFAVGRNGTILHYDGAAPLPPGLESGPCFASAPALLVGLWLVALGFIRSRRPR